VKLPGRKTGFQRALDTIADTLDGGDGALERGLSHMSSSRRGVTKELKAIVPGGARTAGLIAGGVAGLTAGSAGISAYRRSREGRSDDT
jgi:hypothetical protein